MDNVTFMTDLKSVIDTIKVVYNRDGAIAEDGGSRGEFIGTANVEDLKNDAEGNYMKIRKQ